MPVTPQQAMAASPEAMPDAEERKVLAHLTSQIDEHLSTKWTGLFLSVPLPLVSNRVLAWLVRMYSEVGWTVQTSPRRSALASGNTASSVAGFDLALVPRWLDERERNPEPLGTPAPSEPV